MLWRVAVSLLTASALTAGATAAPTLTITRKARSLQPGELVILTIVSNTALSTIEVKAFGHTHRAQALPPTTTRPHAWIALVGIDLDVRPGTYTATVSATGPAGMATAKHRLAVRAKRFATRRLTVDPDFVDPPASEAARIERESAALTAAWEGTAGPSPAPELAFVPPVPDKANSAFGTRSIFNGERRNAHSGADFPSKAGEPIKAPAPGKVVIADDFYFSGGTVVIDHGLGVVSLFAHMSQILVKAGADVGAGEVLGLVGATGRVTGPHLHWTVRVNGARVDPLSLVTLLPGQAHNQQASAK
jgi:murein DD-endopeptidase MepM/ murein hydrolase activator NlpD